ncbi:MAG TPA: hypothetical protein VF710_10555 [Longimicrobium sp.]|jgi:hypothetical protein
MRIIEDAEGRSWDVMVGRGSWGSLVLLFSLRGANENRTADIASETVRQAEQELSALSDDEVRARLAESKPWE